MIKIAIPTSDKNHVDAHADEATFFAVATIANNSISHLEFRPNPICTDDENSHHELTEVLGDCKVMLVRNIGENMIASLEEANIPFEKISEESIADAIQYYLSENDTII
ncbi:MAG TPA: NifB/NifX family molybdenum-iron cluster-binding protein [Bacteroidales bacterium]|nr:NifB/NifX family molybdenum-iron cluster-binding protein [Bacteroidales bacterium]